MKPRLICLVRRHQWHTGWDEDRHQTVWTCNRGGKTRVGDTDPGQRSGLTNLPWGNDLGGVGESRRLIS
jgi:hypothetical protein